MSPAPTAVAAGASGQSTVAPVAPRSYRGNMCGVRVPGLPPVDGGAPDPSLVLSWFYARYDPASRARIRQAWRARGYLDVLVSWPDDRAFGLSPAQHVAICQELAADGFRPCNMLSSKYYDPRDDGLGTLAHIVEGLAACVQADCCSRYAVGFEMDLWNTFESLQVITEGCAKWARSVRRPLYVHFSGGIADWRPNHPGSTFAEYWNAQVGLLSGLLHQRDLNWPMEEYRPRLQDILARFAGHFGVAPDSGFGHPFDLIELEITAQPQYLGQCSEAEGDALGTYALETPGMTGPAGLCTVLGSGNGQQD